MIAIITFIIITIIVVIIVILAVTRPVVQAADLVLALLIQY